MKKNQLAELALVVLVVLVGIEFGVVLRGCHHRCDLPAEFFCDSQRGVLFEDFCEKGGRTERQHFGFPFDTATANINLLFPHESPGNIGDCPYAVLVFCGKSGKFAHVPLKQTIDRAV